MQNSIVPTVLLALMLPLLSSAARLQSQSANERASLEKWDQKLRSGSAKDKTSAIVQLTEITSDEASKLLLRTLRNNLASKQGFYVEYGSYSDGNTLYWTASTSDNGLLVSELAKRKYQKTLPTLRKMLRMNEKWLGISLEYVASAIHSISGEKVKYIAQGEAKVYPAPEPPPDDSAPTHTLRALGAGETTWAENSRNKQLKDLVNVLSIAGGPAFDRAPYFKRLTEDFDLRTLIELVKTGEPSIRPYAIRGVRFFADYPAEVWATLGATVVDQDPLVRLCGVEALGFALEANPGPEALAIVVPQLKQAIADEEPEIREAAINALGKYAGAARWKGELELPKQAAFVFVSALGDQNRYVRLAAANALGQVGPITPQVIPSLIRLTKDPNRDFRSTAVKSLAACAGILGSKVHGKESTETIAVIRSAMLAAAADPVSDVRYEVAQSLGTFGPDHKVVSQLIKMTRDLSRGVRSAAMSSLGDLEIERDRIVPAIVRMIKVKDEDSEVIERALHCLAQFGPDARSAASELRRLLKSEDSRLRDLAADTLEKIDPKRAKRE